MPIAKIFSKSSVKLKISESKKKVFQNIYIDCLFQLKKKSKSKSTNKRIYVSIKFTNFNQISNEFGRVKRADLQRYLTCEAKYTID